MTKFYIGTSGYAYRAWRGSFYPADVRTKEWLTFYASKFNAVEINNTFYRMPSDALLEKWQGEVPGTFKFFIKAPRVITHQRKLEDLEPYRHFLRVTGILSTQLGAIYVQLPPWLRLRLPLLEALVKEPRGSTRLVVEFRHASWFDDKVYQLLQGSDVAMCLVDSEESQTPWVPTASFGYIRMRRKDYSDEDLSGWKKKLFGCPWMDASVFFKHEDEGRGPALAQRFDLL